jgi:hypothetical protein
VCNAYRHVAELWSKLIALYATSAGLHITFIRARSCHRVEAKKRYLPRSHVSTWDGRGMSDACILHILPYCRNGQHGRLSQKFHLLSNRLQNFQRPQGVGGSFDSRVDSRIVVLPYLYHALCISAAW